jgi:Tol biopolymer transport system component
MRYIAVLATALLLSAACGEDPSGPQQWPDGAYLYLGSIYPDTALSWSPGGTVLLFTSYAYSSYCILGFDGITDPVPVAASSYDESAGPNGCWSGEQGLIVYTSYNTDSTSMVRTVPGNLGPLLVVVNDEKNHLHPTWTPTEDSLLICTFDNGYWGMWKTEYHEDTLLTPEPFYTPDFDCLRPSYSPDGEWILFEVSSGGSSDIWLMKHDGTDPHAVIEDSWDNIHPCWGPEDDRFAFASNRSGSYDVWISNLEGSSLVQVTQDPGDDVYPAWNPVYGWFVFSSNREDGGENFDIYSIDAPEY